MPCRLKLESYEVTYFLKLNSSYGANYFLEADMLRGVGLVTDTRLLVRPMASATTHWSVDVIECHFCTSACD